ncbi:hypothetical protein B1748_16740 [Paenibacillus sp. MY03]|uniref:hypothetical protein n=1 Tax=Paenibacillus sp. MY03 TaxID=302980 RepID=UPI000B3D3C22|nr:hypothetical protein [Paenibacillus sp. MY03]OUS75510.1 hypothetical protein B1748_16740 [Paenibacillus sp. MY03]
MHVITIKGKEGFELEIKLWPDDLAGIATMLLSWSILIGLVLRRYRRQSSERPALWRALLVACISLFSFSISFPLGGYVAKLAIVPIGVWLVYLFLPWASRIRYRSYAWTGFWCNYVFLVIGLLGFWGHELVYPKDQLSTYLSKIDHARIVGIHPSAEEGVSLHEARFKELIDDLKPQRQFEESLDWYYEARDQGKEFYPYALLGAEPKRGSGIRYEAYIKSDGLGLIIARDNQYYYYESKSPLLQWTDGRGGSH